MTSTVRPSLATFAETSRSKPGTPCWLCGIPERDEVDGAATAGVRKTVIRRWLAEVCGYGAEATVARVSNHVENHLR